MAWELPESSRVRDKAAKIMMLRIGGMADADIAKEVGLSQRSLRQYLYLAAKNGWLRFEDPADRLEYELVPKIVDNIAYHLKRKDKVMTIEAAKGTGLFKSHQSQKSETDRPQSFLALKIELAPNAAQEAPKVAIAGQIIGVARENED